MLEAPLLSVVTVVLVVADGPDVTLEDGGPRGCKAATPTMLVINDM